MAQNNLLKQTVFLLLGLAIVGNLATLINCADETECSKNDEIDKMIRANLSSEPMSGLYSYVLGLKDHVVDLIKQRLNDDLDLNKMKRQLGEKCLALEGLYHKYKNKVIDCFTNDANRNLMMKTRLDLDSLVFSSPALTILNACKEWRVGSNTPDSRFSRGAFWFN